MVEKHEFPVVKDYGRNFHLIKMIAQQAWTTAGITTEQRNAIKIVLEHYGDDPRIAPLHALAQSDAQPVAWCCLTAAGNIAYFDGKPMVMVGPVGNEHHKTPLYASPQEAQPEHQDAYGGVADLRDAKWLDPECASRGACQSLRFKAAQPMQAELVTAWLIEWQAHGHGPQWWGFNHEPRSRGEWCADSNKAIRFSRQEDAARMRLHIIAAAGFTGQHTYERQITVTEHAWQPMQAEPAV